MDTTGITHYRPEFLHRVRNLVRQLQRLHQEPHNRMFLAAPRQRRQVHRHQNGRSSQDLPLVAPVEPEGTLEMMGTMTMMKTALRATPMKLKKRKRKNSEKKILQRSLFQQDGLSRSRSPHRGPSPGRAGHRAKLHRLNPLSQLPTSCRTC